jgi:hypothetical protein
VVPQQGDQLGFEEPDPVEAVAQQPGAVAEAAAFENPPAGQGAQLPGQQFGLSGDEAEASTPHMLQQAADMTLDGGNRSALEAGDLGHRSAVLQDLLDQQPIVRGQVLGQVQQPLGLFTQVLPPPAVVVAAPSG